jgi:hypothetical protein
MGPTIGYGHHFMSCGYRLIPQNDDSIDPLVRNDFHEFIYVTDFAIPYAAIITSLPIHCRLTILFHSIHS